MKNVLLTVSVLVFVSSACAMQDTVTEQVPVVRNEAAAVQIPAQEVVVAPVAQEEERVQAPVQEVSAEPVVKEEAMVQVPVQAAPVAAVVSAPVQDIPAAPATQQEVAAVQASVIQMEQVLNVIKNPTAQKVSAAIAAGLTIEEMSRQVFSIGAKKSAFLGATIAALVIAFPQVRELANQLLAKKSVSAVRA